MQQIFNDSYNPNRNGADPKVLKFNKVHKNAHRSIGLLMSKLEL